MPELKNYDPGLNSLNFAGIPIVGFADGDSITSTLDEDAYADSSGSQGDVVRVRNRNMLGDLTIVLQAESPSNDRLSALADVDRATGLGVKPLTLTNLNSRTVLHAAKAWIKKRPDVPMGKDAGTRTWVIRCVFDTYHVAGSVI